MSYHFHIRDSTKNRKYFSDNIFSRISIQITNIANNTVVKLYDIQYYLQCSFEQFFIIMFDTGYTLFLIGKVLVRAHFES